MGKHKRTTPAKRNSRKERQDVGRCTVTGKAQFTSKAHAKKKEAEHRAGTRPFRCDHCGYWHLGHQYGQPRAWHGKYAEIKAGQP